ncbi:hypothetical protein, partial [Bacteroides acidifaciens]|uniref:hypothetical protein n=1 Tax=Bacteroides acidifaciens TaxID=85831 RepID=UPI002597DA9A
RVADIFVVRRQSEKEMVEIFNISMFRGDYQWVTNCCFQSGNNAVTPEVFYRHFPECIGMWRMAG